MFNLFSKDIGIDLGTASVLVYIKGKGVVLREPSVVAMDKNTGKLLKVGTDAQAMLGRTPGNIVAMRPLREGVISDYDMTERMLKEFIKKVTTFSLFKPRLLICVPSGITVFVERAVVDAGILAGARRAYLIEEPVAAAIGAGIDITKPDGHMVVDIGGGTADIAVISLGGVVESASIKIAGDKFDEAVVKYIRKKLNVLIGDRTAEELKMSIGCVFPRPEEVTMEIKGRCLMTGLPRVFSVSSSEMIEAFEEVSSRILEAIHGVLERTPPELVADISTNGIVMTGGGARGYRQEPGQPGPDAGRDYEPVPAQADELLIRPGLRRVAGALFDRRRQICCLSVTPNAPPARRPESGWISGGCPTR